jgi:MFS transporter, SP family, arabinose:H+ symporter
MFRHDTAVVSGAIGFLAKQFRLTADLTGWAASSMLVGRMAGAALAGPVGDRFGRKPSLIFCGVLFALPSLALMNYPGASLAGALCFVGSQPGSARRDK